MSLFEQWIERSEEENQQQLQNFWNEYAPNEQRVYKTILGSKTTVLKGTIQELADVYELEPYLMVGFIEGINEALDNSLEQEKLAALNENDEVELNINYENLYKKMVEFKADYLYSLDEWDDIFDNDTKKSLYKEQRLSTTCVKDEKVGRNDPCPCGSGKKHKKCCGAA